MLILKIFGSKSCTGGIFGLLQSVCGHFCYIQTTISQHLEKSLISGIYIKITFRRETSTHNHHTDTLAWTQSVFTTSPAEI